MALGREVISGAQSCSSENPLAPSPGPAAGPHPRPPTGAAWEPLGSNPHLVSMDPKLPLGNFQAWHLANPQGRMVSATPCSSAPRAHLFQVLAVVAAPSPPETRDASGAKAAERRTRGAAPASPWPRAQLTVSFGRFCARLGFISRVANLEVPSCQGRAWGQ